MGKLNHHAIDNGDITLDVPVENSYESVPYPDTTPIKSIDHTKLMHASSVVQNSSRQVLGER